MSGSVPQIGQLEVAGVGPSLQEGQEPAGPGGSLVSAHLTWTEPQPRQKQGQDPTDQGGQSAQSLWPKASLAESSEPCREGCGPHADLSPALGHPACRHVSTRPEGSHPPTGQAHLTRLQAATTVQVSTATSC